jgi:predicted DNA-binding transcriptional regulator AlpA
MPTSSLPQTGFVRQAQLIPDVLPFSAATLWRKVSNKEFPAPIKLGPRITAWRWEDVNAFIDKCSGIDEIVSHADHDSKADAPAKKLKKAHPSTSKERFAALKAAVA